MGTRLNIEGIGKIELNASKDYLATGGEAVLYGHSPMGLVIKIYHDPKRCISEQKFKELSPMAVEPMIIAPKAFVTQNTKRIGYAMHWAKNTLQWVVAVSNDFWTNNNMTADIATRLVNLSIKGAEAVHRHSAIIGDTNEFNILISDDLSKIYWIDVDSYGTKSYKVSALAPGVQDYSSKECTELTDWYGIAIISFMLYTGAHPFKGRHPDFGPRDMVERMKKNVSMLDKRATLPPNIRDFGIIPKEYMSWYEKLFQDGARIAPPGIVSMTGPAAVVSAPIKVISQQLQMDIIEQYPTSIRQHWFYNGRQLVFNGQDPYVINEAGKKLYVRYYKGLVSFLNLTLAAKGIILSDNTLYVVQERAITKVDVTTFGKNDVASIATSWDIMPNSSKVFDGVVYQDILNNPYVLFPEDGAVHNVRLPELSGYKIASMKRIGRVLIVIGYKNNRYDRHLVVFNKDFSSYVHILKQDVYTTDINFGMKNNSVFVILNDEDVLEIRRIEDLKVLEVRDSGLPQGLRLSAEEGVIVAYKGNILYKLSLK
ncbi:MAG TPA: hypothetical protein PKN48_00115 [Bacteroidales bacterium]|nr:hypothetical protein [Bacteroidales bacterium]